MKPAEFFKMSDAMNAKAKQILGEANQEYASDEDKLDNFRTIAFILHHYRPHLKDIDIQLLAEDVAWVYRLKHIVSRLKDISLREDMEGRAIDDQNYGQLLEALRHERIANEPVKIRQPRSSDDGVVDIGKKFKYCESSVIHEKHNWTDFGLEYYCPGLKNNMNTLLDMTPDARYRG